LTFEAGFFRMTALAFAFGSDFEERGADLAGFDLGAGFWDAALRAAAAGFFAAGAFLAAGFADFLPALAADAGSLDLALLGIDEGW
jgi:hypothetical protein